MLVKAVSISLSDVRPEKLTPFVRHSFGGDTRHSALSKDGEYVIYAIEVRGDGTLYFIADSGFSTYPFAYASELFAVIDGRESRLWTRGAVDGASGIVAIPEWVADEAFYEDLVEARDGGKARRIFLEFKRTMDLEFVVPSRVQGECRHLDASWYQCPICDHAWEVNAELLKNEMTDCPKCHSVLVFDSQLFATLLRTRGS